MTHFTSDLHFWHKGVIDYCKRPWATVEEMNAGLIKNWNDTVKPEDMVVILGDFAFCGIGKLKEITAQLQGNKILIRGNHDHNIKKHRMDLGFISIQDKALMKIEPSGLEVLLSHFPYQGNEHDERVFEGQFADQGNWLLHGHVHCNWKIKNKMINVGVDVWDYRPVHAEQVIELIHQGEKHGN